MPDHVNVLTVEVLRDAIQSVRLPRSNERSVHWPTGKVCFVAPIDKVIGMVAGGLVEFEAGHFYLSIRAQHELQIRGITESDGLSI